MSTNKSPSEQVEELSDKLNGMYESRMIHESILDQVEILINMLYKEENKEYNSDNGEVDPNDPSYCPSTPAYSLIDYVKDQRQFVEDYRNIINLSINSDRYITDFNSAIQEVIKLRDIN
jgi:hypothetical protein